MSPADDAATVPLAHQLWSADGDGLPVLLIPGLGLTGAAWRPVAARLDGRPVASLDPLGAGASPTPDVVYEPGVLVPGLLGVLDELGWERAHVVGLSMGGMLAQELALAAPERVASLALVSTYGASDEWSRRLFAIRRRMIVEDGMAAQFDLSILTVSSPRAFRTIRPLIDVIERGFREAPPVEHAYLRQIDFCVAHDALDRLATLAVPTLVVTGARDFLTSIEQARELADAIPGARLEAYPDASHALIFEETERFVGDLAGFLAEHD